MCASTGRRSTAYGTGAMLLELLRTVRPRSWDSPWQQLEVSPFHPDGVSTQDQLSNANRSMSMRRTVKENETPNKAATQHPDPTLWPLASILTPRHADLEEPPPPNPSPEDPISLNEGI